jgi:hypothetical protein
MLYTKMTICGGKVLPYIAQRLDGPWWTIRRERGWQEFEAEMQLCTRNVSSTELHFLKKCNA